MSSPSAEPPYLLIVAGPNGSGKSTAYQDTNIEAWSRSVWIINPDLLTVRIRDVESLPQQEANLQAVRRIEAWLEASIQAHQTVGVETVLSTDKYRRLVAMAKARGFGVRLIYVLLNKVELNIERVKLRVRKGGHAVPEAKIVERRARSLAQLPWFLEQADHAMIYDNSGATARLIAQKADGVITLDPLALPEIEAAVRSIQTD